MVCESGETQTTCPVDCTTQTLCGNLVCDAGETSTTCPVDCTSQVLCGNNACDIGETSESCPSDCTINKCGNQVCDAGESSTICPQDCATQGCTEGQSLQCVTTNNKNGVSTCSAGKWSACNDSSLPPYVYLLTIAGLGGGGYMVYRFNKKKKR